MGRGVRACCCHYSVMDQILAESELMVYEPRQTLGRGLVVCAGRGNGKTSLSNLLHRQFQGYDDPDLPCVVRISISGIRDARSLYGRILEELGSPARISHRLKIGRAHV